jgi:hypothetical protein
MVSLYLIEGKNTEPAEKFKYQKNGTLAKLENEEGSTSYWPRMSSMQPDYLLTRISSIENEIRELRYCLNEVARKMEDVQGTEETITLREVPYQKAKEEIASYFREHDGQEIGYDDLMSALHLDLKTIWSACNELEREGKIG